MQIISNSYRDTVNLGRIIARHIQAADIICLFGQLGAGKTVLVKGIAEGLGIKKEEVSSPSFILMRLHRKAKFPLYHFDLYRLNGPAEITAAGFEEYLYPVRDETPQTADGCLRPVRNRRHHLRLISNGIRQPISNGVYPARDETPQTADGCLRPVRNRRHHLRLISNGIRQPISNGVYGGGVVAVEWAQKLGYLLPKEFLKIELLIKGKNRRLIKISAKGERYKQLSRKIYESR